MKLKLKNCSKMRLGYSTLIRCILDYIFFLSKVKDSTIKKYFLLISRDSSYDAIFRCPESYSLDIKIFAFLKKNVIRLHASVFFLIVAININKSQQAISDLAIHFMSFLARSFYKHKQRTPSKAPPKHITS